MEMNAKVLAKASGEGARVFRAPSMRRTCRRGQETSGSADMPHMMLGRVWRGADGCLCAARRAAARLFPSTSSQACKENGGYTTPQLNDKILLNFHGFARLAGLEPYVALRAIFLEGNCLVTLEGLPPLAELRCLFVQQNALQSLAHLDGCPNLDTLNASHNRLDCVDGLEVTPMLTTLNLAHNSLKTPESLEGLRAVAGTLTTLDLSENKLEDPACLDVIRSLGELRCLYLGGNPALSATRNYRKTMIAALPHLSYLDDRPVFPVERACAVAFAAGGLEAEREARRVFRDEEAARDARNFEAMQEMRREGWRIKRERRGLPPGDTDPSDEGSDGEEGVGAGGGMAIIWTRPSLSLRASSSQSTPSVQARPSRPSSRVPGWLAWPRAVRCRKLTGLSPSLHVLIRLFPIISM